MYAFVTYRLCIVPMYCEYKYNLIIIIIPFLIMSFKKDLVIAQNWAHMNSTTPEEMYDSYCHMTCTTPFHWK